MVYTSAEIIKQMQGKAGYEEYPHTCVIYICTQKIDEMSGTKHEFYQVEKVDGEALKKKDENLIIALNTSGESADPRLQALLQYFYKNEVSDNLTQKLEEAVERIKIDGMMLESYMTFDEVIEQGKRDLEKKIAEEKERAEKAEAKIRQLEEEKKDIVEKSKIEIFDKALAMGLSMDMVMQMTGFTAKEIEKIQGSL